MVRVGAPGTPCFQYPVAAVEVWVGSLRPLAWCWQGEGRVVYIRNLSSNMSSSELKKRFEVFGEIVECQVLSRTNRWVVRTPVHGGVHRSHPSTVCGHVAQS